VPVNQLLQTTVMSCSPSSLLFSTSWFRPPCFSIYFCFAICHLLSLFWFFYIFCSNFCYSLFAEDAFHILSHVCSTSWHSVSALSSSTFSCYQHFLLFLARIYVFIFPSSTLSPYLRLASICCLLSSLSCLSSNPFCCFWLSVNYISSFTVYLPTHLFFFSMASVTSLAPS
jgi:hypothetical protein